MAVRTKLTDKQARVYAELSGVGTYPGSPTWSTADVWAVHEFVLSEDPELLDLDLDAPEGAGYGTQKGASRPKYSGKSYAFEVAVDGESDAGTRPAHHRVLRGAGFVETYDVNNDPTLWYTLKNYSDLTDALCIRRYYRTLAADKVRYRQLLGGRHDLEIMAEAGKLIELSMTNGMGVSYSQADATEAIPALSYPTNARYIYQGATIHLATHRSSSALVYGGRLPKWTLKVNRNVALHLDGTSDGSAGEVTGDMDGRSPQLEIELFSQLIAEFDLEDIAARNETLRFFCSVPGAGTTSRRFGVIMYGKISGIGEEQRRDGVLYRTVTLKGVWPDTGEDWSGDQPYSTVGSPNYDQASRPGTMLALFHTNAS